LTSTANVSFMQKNDFRSRVMFSSIKNVFVEDMLCVVASLTVLYGTGQIRHSSLLIIGYIKAGKQRLIFVALNITYINRHSQIVRCMVLNVW